MLKDLTGQQFGRYFVLKRNGTRGKSTLWLVQCVCGNERTVCGFSLTNGTAKSCGCWRRDIMRGATPKNKLAFGESARNALFGIYKIGARKKRLEWSLTIEQFTQLTQCNCHYCGQPPKSVMKHRGFNGPYMYNGIDRKDNTHGYTIENALPCCKVCNFAKRNMNYNEFITYLLNAGQYLASKEAHTVTA